MTPMSAELSRLCDEARRRPLASRARLHAGLRGAKVTVIGVSKGDDAPADGGLEVWADRDPVLGGVWVPVFTDPTASEAFAERAKRPPDRTLRPATGNAVELFSSLLEVPCFAGVRLDPEGAVSTRLERGDVCALSDKLIPEEAPVLHALAGPAVELPAGIACRFGEPEPGYGPQGRRAVFPEAPGLVLQDFRSLVELELGGEPAWAPCRNYASALAAARLPPGERARLDEALIEALVAFGMYGEAEALCGKALEDGGRRRWALGHRGRVLRRAGRLFECVDFCKEALAECPEEARLYRSLALAYAELEDMAAARAAARRGLAHHPEDATLRRLA